MWMASLLLRHCSRSEEGATTMVKDILGQKHTDEMVSLGQANLKVLRQLDVWCKHLEITPTAAGLLAQMSGLPIGSFRLSCKHATYIPDGMNLVWTSQEFLDRNCRQCAHQEPNGDSSWGRHILAEIDAARTEAAQRKEEMQAAVEDIRRQCRARAGLGRKDDNVTEHQILSWAEQVFDGDEETSRSAARNLTEAAKVAPDLFGEAVVGALCFAAPTEAFHEVSLPVLSELASRSPNLGQRLASTAAATLRVGVELEHCCAIFTVTRPTWAREERRAVIERVIGLRNHIRPFGGWSRRDPRCELVDIAPDYSLSNIFLAQEYDRESETVLGAIRDLVRSLDPDARINGCGVARGLMRLRPKAAVSLAPDIAASLELVESEFGESADGAACGALAQAFLIDADAIDCILAERIESRAPPVQEQLIEVYARVLRARVSTAGDDEEDSIASEDERVRAASAIALRRVLQLLQNEKLDVGPLLVAAQAVNAASRDRPQQLLDHHAVLLGTMAAWSLQAEARPAPPVIEMPGAGPKPPALLAIEKQSRNLRWQTVKRELGKILSTLIDTYPDKFAETLIGSFKNLDSTKHAVFKGEVTRLLGELGKQYAYLPRVLPTLWVALMDQASVHVRYRAVEAIGKCFESSTQPPPSDVVDVVVLHLNDSYKVVHQTAAEVVGYNADWLTQEQATDALARLDYLIQAYRTEDPYQLRSIAGALLSVSRRVPRARIWAVERVLSHIPSGINLLDEQLLDELVRRVRPSEPAAQAVAPVILRWVGSDGARSDDYRDHANEAFSWLHSLPSGVFAQIRALALEEAVKLAQDPRRAISFASLFATHEDYVGERNVLTQARSRLPAGRQFEEVARTMEKLAEAASRNVARVGERVK
jgi:hypothetical protein